MFRYYTVLMFISILSMLCIQLCVSKSGTLNRTRKQLFHHLFSIIAIAAFCEWLGVFLQGRGPSTRVLHIVVKALELSLAPFISVWIARIIESRRDCYVYVLLILHALLECLSGVFGFIYQVDMQSNYTHGQFYWIYVLSYLLTVLYCISIVLRNVKKYQYNGIGFFLTLVLLMLLGIIVQMVASDLRVVYPSLAISSIMLYVFTLEMIHQTDELTELINRRGFENCISQLDQKSIIIFLDVDQFKQVNDTYGHAFGDQVLSTIGKAIRSEYAKHGSCFRYGGDEFSVILTRDLNLVESLNYSFLHAMERLRQKESRLPTVSIGYVEFDPSTSDIESALSQADRMMYLYKKAHRGSQPRRV